MNDADRCRLLHGPYRSPRCRLGGKLTCLVRGVVIVHHVSAGPIPWPQTIVGRSRTYILCGDLVKALRCESELAVAHWWGVCATTVWTWRKALGVPRATEGSSRLWRERFEERIDRVQSLAAATAQDPERRAKIAAARRGRPRPAHVRDAVGRASRGRKASAETRRKMSEAHKRRGTWPPAAGRPWTADEDALVRLLPARGAAEQLGRPIRQVYDRRRMLGMPDGRRRG